MALHWLFFPAVAMSLGWGLRGYIGGGPLGAMIPGALVALALCLLLRRDGADAGIVAAWGAVGVGFGGQETYGQTIGLAIDPATSLWGLTGLALKGAVWGLLGGAVIALALTRDRHTPRALRTGLLLMLAFTWAGWKLVNEPKLIYFSNRLDRPREELWCGLLLGALALLAYMRSAVAWRFAGIAFIGGGMGFGIGGWLQVLGRHHWNTPWIGWWKVMELFFGFLFGLALGWAAYRDRALLARKSEPLAAAPVLPWAAAAVALAAVTLPADEVIPVRFGYTLAGAVLLALALQSARASWQLAISVTYCAFAVDYLLDRPADWRMALWPLVFGTTLAVAAAVARKPEARTQFLLLLWTGNAVSYAKSFSDGWVWNGHTLTEIAFTILGAIATRQSLRTGGSTP